MPTIVRAPLLRGEGITLTLTLVGFLAPSVLYKT